MSVIKKLVTLLRGSARELGQSMVDANATRIYEQEITDAKASIGQAKTELTGVMAQQMQTAREIERIKADVLRHENMALQALDKQKDDLALEVAARVAALEAELNAQTEAHAAYAMQVGRLKDLIRSAETRVREHEREIGIAKTTESVYCATQSISDSMGASGSKLTLTKNCSKICSGLMLIALSNIVTGILRRRSTRKNRISFGSNSKSNQEPR